MSNIKIFVTVRDRLQCTAECVTSLIATTKGRADILIYDNGSEADLPALRQLYIQWTMLGQVQDVTYNRFEDKPEVYWSKNYAWKQFLLRMAWLLPAEREFLVMVDNDVVFEPGWLDACLAIHADPAFAAHNLAVLSPYDGPPDPNTNPDIFSILDQALIAEYPVSIRNAVSSRCWFAPYDFWTQWEPPTEREVIHADKPNRMPTDWYYWQRAAENDLRFAVLEPPLVHDPAGPWPSARMKNRIGDDAQGF